MATCIWLVVYSNALTGKQAELLNPKKRDKAVSLMAEMSPMELEELIEKINLLERKNLKINEIYHNHLFKMVVFKLLCQPNYAGDNTQSWSIHFSSYAVKGGSHQV